MPASYVHQCVAARAGESLFPHAPERDALLAGAEGPDPLFYSIMPTPGSPIAPRLGSILHTQKTDDFALALCDACAPSALTRAYACGFLTHYATDTTFHPFVYARSRTPSGGYSSNAHCLLEHQLETLHFRREGHAEGLPVQMAGVAALSDESRMEIARAFSAAISRVFPERAMRPERIKKSFDDAVALCRLLRSEDGKKYQTLGALLRPFRLDFALHAHMMPLTPPDTDIANDSHTPWASIWTPDEVRTESFDDLFAAACARARELVECAQGYMTGHVSYASLRALHGGNSFDSGLSWQTTCAPGDAPGIRK